MKKTYVNVEWEITFITTKDIITSSAEYISFDEDGILNDKNTYMWEW